MADYDDGGDKMNGILIAAQAGDPKAMQTLFEYVREIARGAALYRSNNEHDRSDVVQTSCIKFFSKIKSIKPVNIKSYIISIVNNAFLDFVRSRKPTHGLGSTDDALARIPVLDPPSRAARDQEEAQICHELIGAVLPVLPPHYRRAVERWLQGVSDRDAAAQEGGDEHSYRALLSRAKSKLLKEMEELRLRRHRKKDAPEEE